MLLPTIGPSWHCCSSTGELFLQVFTWVTPSLAPVLTQSHLVTLRRSLSAPTQESTGFPFPHSTSFSLVFFFPIAFLSLWHTIYLLVYVLFVFPTRISAPQVQDFGMFCSLLKSQLPTQCKTHSVYSINKYLGSEWMKNCGRILSRGVSWPYFCLRKILSKKVETSRKTCKRY